MVHPALGLAVSRRPVKAQRHPRPAGWRHSAPAASIIAALIRAGIRFIASSSLADALPRYSYLPRYPIMLSSVFTARKAKAPGSPSRAKASQGPM